VLRSALFSCSAAAATPSNLALACASCNPGEWTSRSPHGSADPLGRGARECLLASVPEAPDPIRTRLAFEPKGSLSQRKACPL
jgi:hypothetical protein